MIDVAVSPMRICIPPQLGEAGEMNLAELCKVLWAAKQVRVDYKFRLSTPFDGPVGWDTFEEWAIGGSESKLICENRFNQFIDDNTPDDDIFPIGPNISAADATHDFGNNTGMFGHRYPPIFEQLYYARDQEFDVGFGNEYAWWEASLLTRDPTAGGFPATGQNLIKWDDALEIVTRDKDGVEQSFLFPLWSYHSDADEYPWDLGGGTWFSQPWGFLFDESGDRIKITVTKWFGYDGVWDEDTGELLVPDAIRP